MKLFTTFLLVLFSAFLYAQSSSFSQKTLITKRTATWCPNCGAWGWSFAKAIDELENENAILIRAHYSGDLQSQAAADITENFKAVYQPEFYINEEIQSVGSTTWEDKVAAFQEAIDENADSNVDVSTTITSSIEGETISIEVSATLLNALQGDYFLGAYLLENGVENNQSGFGSAVHNRVLRASFTEDSFGEQMVVGEGVKGSQFSFQASLMPEGAALADRSFEILAIVWEKGEEQYGVENVHVSTIGGITSIESLTISHDIFRAYQSGSDLIIDFQNDNKALKSSFLEIYTVSGEKLISRPLLLKSGKNHVVSPLELTLDPQIYFVKLGGNVTKVLLR